MKDKFYIIHSKPVSKITLKDLEGLSKYEMLLISQRANTMQSFIKINEKIKKVLDNKN